VFIIIYGEGGTLFEKNSSLILIPYDEWLSLAKLERVMRCINYFAFVSVWIWFILCQMKRLHF